jgi:NitT/TauT family transport system permease protein
MAAEWSTGAVSGERPAPWQTRKAVVVPLVFVGLLVVWQVAATWSGVPAYLLPAPIKIGHDLAVNIRRVVDNLWFTTIEIVVGYVLAVAASIPLALLIAYSRPAENIFYPPIIVLQIIPKIAIAPVFVIWFGFGIAPKLLIVVLLSFFPIVVAAVAGFKSVDPDVMDLARSTGAGQWRTFMKIRLPHALPSIFTGLKVAAAIAPTAAIVAEFVASDKGLGYLLLAYNGNLDTSMVFAVILVLSVVGLLVYYAVELIERYAIPWHVARLKRAAT